MSSQTPDQLVDIAENSEGEMLLLTACPICGNEFDVGYSPADIETVDEHIANHDPEDLGLDQDGYQYKPMADILIEFHGLSSSDQGGDHGD